MDSSTITNAILLERNEYIKNKTAKSFKNINNGLCTEFATDVINLLGGETDILYGVTNCNFTKNNGTHYYNWDYKLLEESYNMKPPNNLTWTELCNTHFSDHYWIHYNKKFYDAECPYGVNNFFDLPIFKRNLEIKNNR